MKYLDYSEKDYRKIIYFEIFDSNLMCTIDIKRWSNIHSFVPAICSNNDKGNSISIMLEYMCISNSITTEADLKTLLTTVERKGYIPSLKEFIDSYKCMEKNPNIPTSDQISSDPIQYINSYDPTYREYARSLL